MTEPKGEGSGEEFDPDKELAELAEGMRSRREAGDAQTEAIRDYARHIAGKHGLTGHKPASGPADPERAAAQGDQERPAANDDDDGNEGEGSEN